MSLRYTISLHLAGKQFARKTTANLAPGDHLDWFFQTDRRHETSLTTFATPLPTIGCSRREDRLQLTALWLVADRLPDHRIRYLDFAGEISGERGHVQPLVSGRYQPLCGAFEHFRFRVESAAVVRLGDWAVRQDFISATQSELMRLLSHARTACPTPA